MVLVKGHYLLLGVRIERSEDETLHILGVYGSVFIGADAIKGDLEGSRIKYVIKVYRKVKV